MTNHVPFFLRSPSTLEALGALAGSTDLVLYCGAGVTIDRTGLTWSGLLREVFRQGCLRDRDGRESKHKAIEYLLDHLSDEEQIASVLTEYFTADESVGSNDWLTLQLQPVLYVDHEWSKGNLLPNIAKLCVSAGPRLSSLTILTTNYDVYLEEEIANAIEAVRAQTPHDATPGLERLVSPLMPSDDEWQVKSILPPDDGAITIRLVYLHGRVGRVGIPTEGTIVLDEVSFANSRNAVSDKLAEYIADRAMLSVGASVTDIPLIQALANSKRTDSSKRRFALIHPSIRLDEDPGDRADGSGSATIPSLSDLEEALRFRGQHLGFTPLYPLSHSQTAQFVEELELALKLESAQPPMSYHESNVGVNYEARLNKWVQEFSSLKQDPQADYQLLINSLDDIRYVLAGEEAENDALRLEMWLRLHPTSDNRTLTLFANSAGPLIGTAPPRKESLEPRAPNASVHAFLDGRPRLMNLTNLKMDERDASRWKTFLAVPIAVQIAAEAGKSEYVASVPVGVVTLTGLEVAALQQRFDALPPRYRKALLDVMSDAGLQLVGRGDK
jgi:hypothetical protein